VKLVSPIGGAPGGSGNLSTSLSTLARLAGHPKFVWVFNANYDGTIFYNDLYNISTYVTLNGYYAAIQCQNKPANNFYFMSVYYSN
jgi:hypothetical protein